MWKYSPTNLSADIVRCLPCSPTRAGFSPSLKCSETRLTDEENSAGVVARAAKKQLKLSTMSWTGEALHTIVPSCFEKHETTD